MIVLVGGVSVKNNRQLLNGRWDKNDDKDLANVADLIAQGKCLFFEYPLMTLRDVRVLLALKRRLRKREHSISTCIRNNIIAQYFPELDKHFEYRKELAPYVSAKTLHFFSVLAPVQNTYKSGMSIF